MPKLAYVVRFRPSPAVETGNVGYFAEDLYRAVHSAGLGDVPNEAVATDEVHVVVSATRHLSTVLRHIRTLLKKHRLSEDATISRIST